MPVVVEMAGSRVDAEAMQLRDMGRPTHDFGDCRRPIDQTDSAAGKLPLHVHEQIGTGGSRGTIAGRQRDVADRIEDADLMAARALRQIIQESRSRRPKQFRTMVAPKIEHGRERRCGALAGDASGVGGGRWRGQRGSLSSGRGGRQPQ